MGSFHFQPGLTQETASSFLFISFLATCYSQNQSHPSCVCNLSFIFTLPDDTDSHCAFTTMIPSTF